MVVAKSNTFLPPNFIKLSFWDQEIALGTCFETEQKSVCKLYICEKQQKTGVDAGWWAVGVGGGGRGGGGGGGGEEGLGIKFCPKPFLYHLHHKKHEDLQSVFGIKVYVNEIVKVDTNGKTKLK